MLNHIPFTASAMRWNKLLLIGLLSILSGFASTAYAQWEDTERLRMAAAQAMGADNVQIAVDPNTRVPRCTQPPEARVRARTRTGASIEIHCEAPAWRIYVPARSNGTAMVAVLTRPVAAGSSLQVSDFSLQQRSTASLGYGWFESRDGLVGKRVRRALPVGKVLSPNDLEQERMVSTGDTVTILSRNHGIEVRMKGQALSHGARHEQIRVRNNQSGRTVDATVIAAGTVEVAR
ncbi:MAG: flagellar basal body P-ring formation chaperone FlgA [Algiphilus sp.]